MPATTQSKSQVRTGCLLKRFGEERATVLRWRSDELGRLIFEVKRHSDGAVVEDWATVFVHAKSCGCRG